MEKLLTPKELANLLGLSVQTIYNRRCMGAPLPIMITIGRRIRFRPTDVDAWLETISSANKTSRNEIEQSQQPKKRGRPTKAAQISRRNRHH